MSGRSAVSLEPSGRVLVVGDSERSAGVATALSEAVPGQSLVLTPSVAEALDRLEREAFHCVVCAADDDSSLSAIGSIRDVAGAEAVIAAVDRDRADAALEAGATDVVYPDEPPGAVAARIETAMERVRLAEADDERYRSILEGAGVPVLVLDADGSVRDATSAIESASGYTPDELARTDLYRLVHPDDRPAVRETVAALVDGGLESAATETARLRGANGAWRVSEFRFANRLEDPRVEGIVVAVSRTVPTESRGDVDPDPYEHVGYPLFALGPDWEIAAANDAAERLLGRPTDDLLGTVLWDLLPGEARDAFVDRCHEARRTDSVVEFTAAYPPLEATLSAHVHPTESGVIVYAREEPAAARSERDRARLLEATVDALEDAVLVLDGETIDHANAAAVDLADGPSLVGRGLEAVFDPPVVDRILERARSPIVRRTDPIETTLERAGETRPVAVTVAPLRGGDRAVCVVRDDSRRKRRRAALEAARKAAAGFADDATDRAVCDRLAGAALEVADGTAALVYRAESAAFRPAALATDAGVPLDSLPPVPRGEPALERPLGGEPILEGPRPEDAGDASSRLAQLRSQLGLRADRVLAVPLDDAGVLLVTDPTAAADEAGPLVDSLASAAALAIARLEREATATERDRDLERARDRLGRLEELAACRRRIDRAAAGADDRSDLERTVCAELAALEGIALAWIADAVGSTGDLSPRARAGEADYLDAGVLDRVDGRPLERSEPARRTAATGEATVVESVDEADAAAEWTRAALDRGFESIVSVPIRYDGYRYGTLSAYATDRGRFDEATRAALRAIGETVGFAINALEAKRALVTDGITRLEFGVARADDPLAGVASRLGDALHVESVVPRSEDRATVFATVAGADADRLEDRASAVDGVESARPLAERGGDVRLELVVRTRLVSTLADYGGVLRSIDGGDDRLRLVVDLPRGADVRAFVDVLDRTYPGIELLARREADRSARTRRDFRSALEDRLTERQLRSLEAAYYGGFFEWPRERTGEEVATSIGVSQPTFNRHFRAAERKLYTLLFDGD